MTQQLLPLDKIVGETPEQYRNLLKAANYAPNEGAQTFMRRLSAQVIAQGCPTPQKKIQIGPLDV